MELLQRRRDLRQKLDAIPRLSAERREIENRIAAADRDLAAAEQRHTVVVIPLRAAGDPGGSGR